MTVSRDERLENARSVLVAMRKKLGEQAVWRELFAPDDELFRDVFTTTWKFLVERGRVKAHYTIASADYELTGFGWLEAIEATGEIDSPEFQERFGRLCAALKRRVKGRREEGSVGLEELANETNLPEGWVYNVIESRLWELRYGRVGAEFDDADHFRNTVWIPIDFNMDRLYTAAHK